MTTTIFQRHTLADGFLPVGDEKTQSALKAAQQSIGDTTWKAGYSKETCDQVRKTLKENGVNPVASLSGRLVGVNYTQTTYNGKPLVEMLVTLEKSNGDTTILIGDMRSEFSQELLRKLDAATQTPARTVTIGGFTHISNPERGGYVDQFATLTGEDGQGIRETTDHFSKALDRRTAAADALRTAGVTQPPLVQEVCAAAFTAYFTDLTGQIGKRLRLQEKQITPTIEQSGQVSGLFLSAQDAGPDRALIVVGRTAQPIRVKEPDRVLTVWTGGRIFQVDVPRQTLPEGIETGTPIKLRYDRNNGVTVEVGKATPALTPEAAAGVAKTLHEKNLSAAEIVTTMRDESNNLSSSKIAMAMYRGAGLSADEVSRGLYDGLTLEPADVASAMLTGPDRVDVEQVARALHGELELTATATAQALRAGTAVSNLEIHPADFFSALRQGCNLETAEVVSALKTGAEYSANDVASAVRHGSSDDMARALHSFGGLTPSDIAGAMLNEHGGNRHPHEVAAGLHNGLGLAPAEIADALQTAAVPLPDVAKALNKAGLDAAPSVQVSDNAARIEDTVRLTGKLTSVEPTSDPQRDLVHVQRAGVDVSVTVPAGTVSRDLESGTPIKLRYEPKAGLQVEAGPQPSRGKSAER